MLEGGKVVVSPVRILEGRMLRRSVNVGERGWEKPLLHCLPGSVTSTHSEAYILFLEEGVGTEILTSAAYVSSLLLPFT